MQKERSPLKKVIYSYLDMAHCSLVVLGIARAASSAFNDLLPLHVNFIMSFEYLGYFCWVTALGNSGYKIMTWSQGETPQERLDDGISKALSLIGVFSFIFAKELIAKT